MKNKISIEFALGHGRRGATFQGKRLSKGIVLLCVLILLTWIVGGCVSFSNESMYDQLWRESDEKWEQTVNPKW